MIWYSLAVPWGYDTHPRVAWVEHGLRKREDHVQLVGSAAERSQGEARLDGRERVRDALLPDSRPREGCAAWGSSACSTAAPRRRSPPGMYFAMLCVVRLSLSTL